MSSGSIGLFGSLRRAPGIAGLFCIFGSDPVVVGFILVHSGAPLGSSGSFLIVWLIRARPVGRRVHWRLFGLFRRSQKFVEFIRSLPGGRWVHLRFV